MTEWKKVTLGDVLVVLKNGMNCEQTKSNNGAMITRIETISRQTVDLSRVGFSYISEDDKRKHRILPNDILFSHINSPIHVGKTAIYEGGSNLFHGVNLLLMRSVHDVDAHFLNHYLNHLFKSGFWRLTCKQSVNQASVNQKDIRAVPFSYPPLAIQKAIVTKLDAAFASIDTAIAAAEKNAENAKQLFAAELEDLLVRDDADWRSYSFDEICEIQSKLVDPRESEHQQKLHIGAGNIDAGTGNLQNVITAQQENLISGKFTFTQDMVLYSKIRPYLKKVAMPDFDGLCSADVYPLWPKPTVIRRVYLFYVLLSNYFTTYAISGSERAGMPKVNRDHLFAFKIKLPNISVQKDIERRIGNLSIQCDILASSQTAKASALSQLKQSLLQQAFSGQLVDA